MPRGRGDHTCRQPPTNHRKLLMPSKSLAKSALLNLLAEQTETSRKTAAHFLDVLAAIGYKEVKRSGEFILPGFGKLVKQKRKVRTGAK